MIYILTLRHYYQVGLSICGLSHHCNDVIPFSLSFQPTRSAKVKVISFELEERVTGLTHNNVLMNIKHIVFDVLHDLILLLFTTTCIYCKRVLSFYNTKGIHIIDNAKIMRGLVILMECKGYELIYGHSSFSCLKNRRRYITRQSLNSPKKVFYLCDLLGFTTLALHDYNYVSIP
jgi:hypothetical protein